MWLGEIPTWWLDKHGYTGRRAYWTPCIDVATLPEDHPSRQPGRKGIIIYHEPEPGE